MQHPITVSIQQTPQSSYSISIAVTSSEKQHAISFSGLPHFWIMVGRMKPKHLQKLFLVQL